VKDIFAKLELDKDLYCKEILDDMEKYKPSICVRVQKDKLISKRSKSFQRDCKLSIDFILENNIEFLNYFSKKVNLIYDDFSDYSGPSLDAHFKVDDDLAYKLLILQISKCTKFIEYKEILAFISKNFKKDDGGLYGIILEYMGPIAKYYYEYMYLCNSKIEDSSVYYKKGQDQYNKIFNKFDTPYEFIEFFFIYIEFNGETYINRFTTKFIIEYLNNSKNLFFVDDICDAFYEYNTKDEIIIMADEILSELVSLYDGDLPDEYYEIICNEYLILLDEMKKILSLDNK